MENKLKDLQKDLKELNELHDYKKEEKYDLWRECAQAHKILYNKMMEQKWKDEEEWRTIEKKRERKEKACRTSFIQKVLCEVQLKSSH